MSRKRPIQIAVLGSDVSICTEDQYKYAYEVGKEIAKHGAIALTGGGGGVMEAALKGAKEEGGMTVGVIPEAGLDHANDYCDVGFARDEINIASSHGVILVGGGAGTLNEATFAYMLAKPIVSVVPSGGTAEKFAGEYLDIRKTEKIEPANSAKEAVEKIIKIIEER
ncbi:TIGR00725 family protein [Nanoarchaeota archaeon]